MTLETIQNAAAMAARVELPPDFDQDQDADFDQGEGNMDARGQDDPGMDEADMDRDADAPLPDPEAPEAEAALFELNDFGNGRRMAHYFGENLRHVPRIGWFRWDGIRWVADEDGVSVRADAQEIGARILHEIPHIALQKWQLQTLERWVKGEVDYKALAANKERSEAQDADFALLCELRNQVGEVRKALSAMKTEHRKHAKASGNSPKITNMMAEGSVALRMDINDLNKNPDMVNTQSGVLHFTQALETGADVPSWREPKQVWQVDLVAHDRAQMITKVMNSEYNPDAPAETFKAFFERVQPDPELRGFIQRFAGYSLLGRTTEHKLIFNYGIGRNGKSTLVDILAYIFADYGTTLPIESLTGSNQRKGSEATPDLAKLPGARFVRASEAEQGEKLKEALIKSMTGGEPMPVRRLWSESVEFYPEFKLWLSANHKPEVRGADDGIWSRIMLVPWSVQIPDAERDVMLPEKLKAERAGILSWMVEGALDYLNNGLAVPDAVKAATAVYRQESDPMRDFLTTECEITADQIDRVTAPKLRDAFNAWQLAQGQGTWTANVVTRRIMERAGVVKSPEGGTYEKRRSNGETLWLGLRLLPRALERLEEYQFQIDRKNERAN